MSEEQRPQSGLRDYSQYRAWWFVTGLMIGVLIGGYFL